MAGALLDGGVGVGPGLGVRRHPAYPNPMIVDEIRRKMMDAMRGKRAVERDILKTALGELQTAEARAGGQLSEEDAEKVLRKLIKSIDETLQVVKDADQVPKLEEERSVLSALLPEELTVDEIVAALAPVRADIEGAPASGPAVGVAMKHLKAAGATVNGKDVGAAVAKIRS